MWNTCTTIIIFGASSPEPHKGTLPGITWPLLQRRTACGTLAQPFLLEPHQQSQTIAHSPELCGLCFREELSVEHSHNHSFWSLITRTRQWHTPLNYVVSAAEKNQVWSNQEKNPKAPPQNYWLSANKMQEMQHNHQTRLFYTSREEPKNCTLPKSIWSLP